MASSTPNMGLSVWTLPSDTFSSVELRQNFAALDSHDHTEGKGVQIPVGGLAEAAVTSEAVAPNAITASKIQSGAVTDTKLASPNNHIWKTLYQTSRVFTDSGVSPAIDSVFYLDELPTVAGTLMQFRVYAVLTTNNINPGVGFSANFGQLVSSSGDADEISHLISTQPGYDAITFDSSEVDANVVLLAEGFTQAGPSITPAFYGVSIQADDTLAAGSMATIDAYITVRHVPA